MQINFTAPASGQINLSITLISTAKFYVVEADAFSNFSANAAGVGVKQDTTALAAAPNGTFVTRVHQPLAAVSSAAVGALTLNNTTVTGTIDVLRNHTFLPQLTLSTGTLTAPDSNGRGTLVYTDSGAVSTSYQYYVIDANTFWLMVSDPTQLGTGEAERQASGNLALAGNYAFGSSGDTDATFGAARTVGVFTASPGSLSGGGFDSVEDGISVCRPALHRDVHPKWCPGGRDNHSDRLTGSAANFLDGQPVTRLLPDGGHEQGGGRHHRHAAAEHVLLRPTSIVNSPMHW